MAYRVEDVLALPYHRYWSLWKALAPDKFPEHFQRVLDQGLEDAVSVAEELIALFQRNRAAGRGIKRPEAASD